MPSPLAGPVHNWAGNVTFTPPELQRPGSVEELQELVAASPRIRALGSGHSFNRIADTDGVLVSVRDLAGEIDVDGDAVTVPAGATYGQVGAVLHEAQSGDAAQAKVVIIRDGLQREIQFTREQPSILDAASAAGLEVPYSCTSGVCGTCRAKLVEGEVRMERNFALDKKEVAAGYVLTCQAHPVTERVVLSFDVR